jgi:hypothetical protein
MSKFLHGPPKFSRGPSVVRGPSVGDRWPGGLRKTRGDGESGQSASGLCFEARISRRRNKRYTVSASPVLLLMSNYW